jgi:hypothetical protein
MDKNLIDYINEARTKGAKNKPKGTPSVTQVDDYDNTTAVVNMGNRQKKVVDLDALKGKNPKQNGSHGKFAIDEPTDNDVMNWDEFDAETISENELVVMQRIASEEDFFILGKAGWGKTQIIKKCAKKYNRSIITVYLDKIAKEDLGGIPVPKETQYGNYQIDQAMPAWAAFMLAHPERDFLLFFDEMNQATPDVQNALMPIILEKTICGYEFENFMCAAAGNFSDENEAVYELSKPLMQRLGNEPIIWSTHNDDAWKASMNHLKTEWLGKINNPEFFDVLAENAMLFESPRLVENYILKQLHKLLQNKENNAKLFKAESFYKSYKKLLTPEAKENVRKYDDVLKRLGELAYAMLSDKGTSTSSSRRNRSKNALQINNEDYEWFKEIASDGGYEDEGQNYAVTRENFGNLVDPEEYNAEQIELIKLKLDNDIKWKFKTNDEFFKKQKTVATYKNYKLAE